MLNLEPLPLELFKYELPDSLIAHYPVEPPDSCRLLVAERAVDGVRHHIFNELPELLREGDLLVVNETQVIPARVVGTKPTGGQVELLFERPIDGPIHTARRWRCMGRPGKALKPGKTIVLGEWELYVSARDGMFAEIECDRPLWPLLEGTGQMPLPPYIKRDSGAEVSDSADYQSVFAKEPGAVAAPTASLHFTAGLNEVLERSGISFAQLTLHVGPGTFLPVRPECGEDIREHNMHGEVYSIPKATLEAIEDTKKKGGRVIPVGTTALRTLETWARTGESEGESKLFLYPGQDLLLADGLITNFHLPGSTLMMLVAAILGVERTQAIYAEAVREAYRFFSYGDAMIIL